MTAVMDTLFISGDVPILGEHIVRSNPYLEDQGSVRVLEKRMLLTARILRMEIHYASSDRHEGQDATVLRR